MTIDLDGSIALDDDDDESAETDDATNARAFLFLSFAQTAGGSAIDATGRVRTKRRARAGRRRGPRRTRAPVRERASRTRERGTAGATDGGGSGESVATGERGDGAEGRGRGERERGGGGPGGPGGGGGGGGAGGGHTRVISGADPRARRAARSAATQVVPPPPGPGGGMFGTGPSAYGEPPRGGGAPPPPPNAAPAPYGAPSGPYGGGQGAPHGVPPGPPMRGPPSGPIGADPAAVTEYVMCPPEKAGKVIGHGGDKINSIQAESGASVKIQNQSDVGPGQPRRITITGSPDRVARASQLVYALIQDGARARAAARGGGSEIFVPVDPEHFGKIIGRGGDTIRRLQEESGVRMQVDRANSRVQITGDASGCEVARTLLREVLDASPDAAATSGQTTTEIPAQGQEGRIIGKGGENIRALSTQTGAKITIIKETGMVRVSGDADKVEAAVAVVEDFIDKQINPVRVTNAGMPVDERAPESYGGDDGGGGGGLTPYKPLWETHQSPEGYTYYYNTTTGETQWEEPDDYDGYS